MKTDLIQTLNKNNMKEKITDFRIGDTVRVHQKIIEGNKERIQVFEGVVIKQRRGKNVNGTFTVRKISEGVGVERTYLVHSPKVAKIDVVRRAKVRRANLSYLRALTGKRAKLREKQFDSLIVNVKDEEPKEEAPKSEKAEDQEIEPTDASLEEDQKKDADAEVTEISAADEEDEQKLKDMSTEDLAKQEAKESKKAHEKEDENYPEDETNQAEVEVEEGLEKAEDEDTKEQK